MGRSWQGRAKRQVKHEVHQNEEIRVEMRTQDPPAGGWQRADLAGGLFMEMLGVEFRSG